VGLLLLDGHLSMVEGRLLVVNHLCHGLGSVDGVTSHPLLQLHLLLLPGHRLLPGDDRDLPVNDPTHLLMKDLVLLLEPSPFLGSMGGHHLDAVPQPALLVREPKTLHLELLPLPPEARFGLLHRPLGLDQEAGKRDLHRAREEGPSMYHLRLIPCTDWGPELGAPASGPRPPASATLAAAMSHPI
jgi:hypothetical protein